MSWNGCGGSDTTASFEDFESFVVVDSGATSCWNGAWRSEENSASRPRCRVSPVFAITNSVLLRLRDSVRLLNSIQNRPTSYQKPLIGVPCTPSSMSSDSNGSETGVEGSMVRVVPAISKKRVGRHP